MFPGLGSLPYAEGFVKKPPPKPSPEALEPTVQVRVRAPRPRIGRRPTDEAGGPKQPATEGEARRRGAFSTRTRDDEAQRGDQRDGRRNAAAGPAGAPPKTAPASPGRRPASIDPEQWAGIHSMPLAEDSETEIGAAEWPRGDSADTLPPQHRPRTADTVVSPTWRPDNQAWANFAIADVAAALEAPARAVLDRIFSGQAEGPEGDGRASPKRSLEALTAEASFQRLGLDARVALLRGVIAHPEDATTAKSALALVKTRALELVAPGEANALLETWSRLAPESMVLLARIAARNARDRGAVEDRDRNGTGLLTHLSQLVAAESRALDGAWVRPVLATLAHPGKLPIGRGLVGALRTIEFLLAQQQPAELARLAVDAASPARLLRFAGGLRAVLEAAEDTAEDWLFDALTALSGPLDIDLKDVRPRLRAGDVLQIAEQVFGHSYEETDADRLLGERPPASGPTLVSVYTQATGERVFALDSATSEHVYLRSPHGRSEKQKGARRNHPTRTVVDAERHVDAMDRNSFERDFCWGIRPRLG